MTAQIFTSVVINSLFLAFLAAFYNPNCDGLRKTLWGIAVFFWSVAFALNLWTILRVYGWLA